jgi:MoxR-like ATPase
LLEGVPGTAKTLMAKTLAHLVQAQFTRIQFTPDLMPSDILGTSVFDINSTRFYLKKGPIFTQILLADEINRAPAKTQSALLEAMEERQINLEGERHPWSRPSWSSPPRTRSSTKAPTRCPKRSSTVSCSRCWFPTRRWKSRSKSCAASTRASTPTSWLPPACKRMLPAASVVGNSAGHQAGHGRRRHPEYIARQPTPAANSPDLMLGASARAATHVLLAAKTYAALQGRNYVTPDDVKFVVTPVFRHRMLLKPEAEIEGLDADAVIKRLLSPGRGSALNASSTLRAAPPAGLAPLIALASGSGSETLGWMLAV